MLLPILNKMLKIFKTTLKNWFADDPFTNSAAAAYYAIFSFPGLIIIVMSLGALVFDATRVEAEVMETMTRLFGTDTAESFYSTAKNLERDDTSILSMMAGVATLAFGATGLFVQLQRSLNKIWDTDGVIAGGLAAFIKSRIISLGMIFVIGFLLLVSLMITTVLTVFQEWLTLYISPLLVDFIVVLNGAISFGIIAFLFSSIIKVLPDRKVPKRAALKGGALSAFLFMVGQYALQFYFETASPSTGFGAAGSLILVMIWVFYSCMILLLGAEFAKTIADRNLK